jgi:threonine dehydratase
MHTTLATAHMLIEVGTAAALAGAWLKRDLIRNRTVVLLFSGANADTGMIRRALETPPLF